VTGRIVLNPLESVSTSVVVVVRRIWITTEQSLDVWDGISLECVKVVPPQ